MRWRTVECTERYRNGSRDARIDIEGERLAGIEGETRIRAQAERDVGDVAGVAAVVAQRDGRESGGVEHDIAEIKAGWRDGQRAPHVDIG